MFTDSHALASISLAHSVLASPSVQAEAGYRVASTKELIWAPTIGCADMDCKGGAGGGGGVGSGDGGGLGGGGAMDGGGASGRPGGGGDGGETGDGCGGGGGGAASVVNALSSPMVRYRSPLRGPARRSVTNVPAVVPPQFTRNGPAPTGTVIARGEQATPRSPYDVPTNTSNGDSHA